MVDLSEKLVLALPKGRILGEVMPLVNLSTSFSDCAKKNPTQIKQIAARTINPLLSIILEAVSSSA